MRTPVFYTRLALLLPALWVGSATLAQAPATPEPAPATPHATAAAQESQATLSKGEIKAQREFKMLDFNGDGKLSRSEVKLFPRLANAFDDADTDGDGYVSYEEVRAFAAQYRAQRDRQKASQAAAASPIPPATPAAPEARP